MGEKIELVQRLDIIRGYCNRKKVLHLGCTNDPFTEAAIENGSLLHFEIEKFAGELYGFDFDQEGLDILASHGSTNLHRADLEHLDELDLDTTFDVIVAGEMIEHLNNPGLFLSGIRRFMSKDTALIITTLSAYCAFRFVRYGMTKNHGRHEPVHPDHVAYYSYATLNLLVKRHGLDVDKFMFYDLGTEYRGVTPLFFRIINDLAVRFAPQYADGVIAICRLPQSGSQDGSTKV